MLYIIYFIYLHAYLEYDSVNSSSQAWSLCHTDVSCVCFLIYFSTSLLFPSQLYKLLSSPSTGENNLHKSRFEKMVSIVDWSGSIYLQLKEHEDQLDRIYLGPSRRKRGGTWRIPIWGSRERRRGRWRARSSNISSGRKYRRGKIARTIGGMPRAAGCRLRCSARTIVRSRTRTRLTRDNERWRRRCRAAEWRSFKPCCSRCSLSPVSSNEREQVQPIRTDTVD